MAFANRKPKENESLPQLPRGAALSELEKELASASGITEKEYYWTARSFFDNISLEKPEWKIVIKPTDAIRIVQNLKKTAEDHREDVNEKWLPRAATIIPLLDAIRKGVEVADSEKIEILVNSYQTGVLIDIAEKEELREVSDQLDEITSEMHRREGLTKQIREGIIEIRDAEGNLLVARKPTEREKPEQLPHFD